ncbi:MAG: CoA transferase, partial [Faecalibacterium sp.]|nr:CoA transferase [Faecalibacterium sp.]
DALVEAITAVTKTMKRAEIEKKLLAVDVPASSVLTFIEAYTSDHANAVGLTQMVDQKKIGMMRFYANPLHFDNEPCKIRSGCPLLGQDTTDILKDLGYDDAAIAKLYEDGVVGASLI